MIMAIRLSSRFNNKDDDIQKEEDDDDDEQQRLPQAIVPTLAAEWKLNVRFHIFFGRERW